MKRGGTPVTPTGDFRDLPYVAQLRFVLQVSEPVSLSNGFNFQLEKVAQSVWQFVEQLCSMNSAQLTCMRVSFLPENLSTHTLLQNLCSEFTSFT